MSRIETFISILSDSELAFLYKYKYATYLQESQSIIDKEIKKRGLNQLDVDKITKEIEFNANNTGCLRCNSQQQIRERIEYTNTPVRENRLTDKTAYTNRIECAVCGYKLYDGNENPSIRSFWHLIKRVLFKK